MKIREVRINARFEKNYKKLPYKIKGKAKVKERIFRENVFHSILRTHKLHGEEKEAWAFWIDYTYRIKFIFLSEGVVLFLDVGTHDIYN
ncbi:type II toxin-antitoxin system mRNA interferase toxin, RelE/StbE family [Candidatus Nomurabacteria bacterium]|nr:type II toxin-antitoxin system mRNA interferase toxin, RelE/StbE family [Candidatus Nomurabacteria bacterium]